MKVLCEATEEVGCHVVLDVDEAAPARRAAYDLLLTVKSAEVVSLETSPAPKLPMDKVQRWRTLAREGDLATPFAELGASPELSEDDKSLLRLQLYSDAGNAPAVRVGLEATRDLLTRLPNEQAVRVAEIAEGVDADDLATELMNRALEDLRGPAALERALKVADGLGDEKLVARARSALEAVAPASAVLRHHRAATLANQRRFGEAARLLESDVDAEIAETAAFWGLLSEHLEGRDTTDAKALLEAVASRLPARVEEARRLAAARLAREGRVDEALSLLLREPYPHLIDGEDAVAVLGVVQQSVLRGSPVSSEEMAYALERVVEALAARPADAPLRFRVLRSLGPDLLGLGGVAFLVHLLAVVARRPVQMRMPRIRTRLDPSLAQDEISGFADRAFQWLEARSPMMIGSLPLPAEVLGIPADQAFAVASDWAERSAEAYGDSESRKQFRDAMLLVAAIAPLSSTPNEDLVVIRQVGMRLAQNGHHQHARDWAEQVLALAGDDPARARLAWTAFAEIYARTGHVQEAMLGLCCAFVAHDETTWEDVWHESQIGYRLLRDTGLTHLARVFLDGSRLALKHLGLEALYGQRLETDALQLDVWEYEFLNAHDAERLGSITRRATDNLRRVLQTGDESPPATSILASALRLGAQQSVEVPPDAAALLDEALRGMEGRIRTLIGLEAASAPNLEGLVTLVRGIERARYSEDVGYDIRQLTPLARRLLANEGARDPVAAVYAVEVLAERSVSLPGPEDDRLTDAAEMPAAAAREATRANLAVVVMGMAEDRLVHVTAADAALQAPVSEDADTFSADQLGEWAETYPYGYSEVRDPHEFYVSTEGIGLSALPGRAVIVASTALQAFPPNLFRIDNQFAGWTRALAVAPSLTWLDSARRNAFRGDGRRLAWLPSEGSKDPLDPLNVISGEIAGTLAEHGITLSTTISLPVGTRGADLAVIAAHGGLTGEGRYFRVVADDSGAKFTPAAFAASLAGVGTVVLFVCSAGRLDQHPGATAVLGMARRLLAQGCRAVIAPAWPLEVSVPGVWLPAFLTEWERGSPVIDACFAANGAAQAAFGWNPGRALAMNVYGDPLAAKTP